MLFGVIMSLGASSVIGNIMAGYTMTYRRMFTAGDRIRIGEHFGDVAEVRLLVTRLRTPKNEIVAIPNATILTAEVVNYSKLARKDGLILHTTVGIGYETPWRQVEAMLREAAARTPGLLREPPPFVLQRALGDFCVTYEINAQCRHRHRQVVRATAVAIPAPVIPTAPKACRLQMIGSGGRNPASETPEARKGVDLARGKHEGAAA